MPDFVAKDTPNLVSIVTKCFEMVFSDVICVEALIINLFHLSFLFCSFYKLIMMLSLAKELELTIII